MRRLARLLGSLTIAVALLMVIAGVLAWGTIYETRFGTAAVQRFIYHAWWFQALLAFLAVNLAVAALQRWPWTRRHLPFVLAHIGIILILLGGILGGRFGIEGQMIIPEGQAEHVIETPGNVLVVHSPTSGASQSVPTWFETQAWVHEPNLVIPLVLGPRTVQLTVDHYYPDAVTEEEVTDGGAADNPALQVQLAHDERQETMWLMSRDPERFGVGWEEAHVLFLEPPTSEELDRLLGRAGDTDHPRGMLSLTLPGMTQAREIPVPERPNHVVAIEGTPYRITFKDYLPDFAMTEQGIVSRSLQPNNPAISFILTGPEGADAYLLFALHPDFQMSHGLEHRIAARVSYTHAAGSELPPQCIGLLRSPSGALIGVLTDREGARQVINPVEVGTRYAHASLGYQFTVQAYAPRALVAQRITNRSNEVHAEAVHLLVREGARTAQAWLTLRQTATLSLGDEPIMVDYRPAQRELPVTIKLLDFRKIDYPGIQMASGFEADVQLTDSARGVILMRKISMNNPLRYRGFSFFQSSYIDGPTQTTVLSVRSDPGTPFVYAGFIVVIAGVVSLFALRRVSIEPAGRHATRRARTRRAS